MLTTSLNLIALILFLSLFHSATIKKWQLSYRILLSLIFGIVYGFALKFSPDNWLLQGIKNTLYFMGYGYLALLKMLVTPLILTSIIHAILNLGSGNENDIKKMSFAACAMLLLMTAFASLIGMGVGFWLEVGKGLTLPAFLVTPKHTYTGLADTLLGMLPSNPILAMTQENTIAVVLFAVLLGVAARMLDIKDHDKMLTFKQFIASLFAIVKKLATLVLRLTPYGVLSLLTLLIYDQGLQIFSSMLNFVVAMYIAMILTIAMHSLILVFKGENLWSYFKNAYAPLLVAFTTRSSFGTLPVTEETLHNKFKVKQITATFIPSIGATIGMNACSGIFPAMLVVMTINILHIPLTPYLVIMVMFINAIASLGISGIPGTAYIAATITLTSLNLPYGIIALVQGIDPIIDMGRTATNVNAVMTTALVVDPYRSPHAEMTTVP
jgi:uncharacterized protein